MTFFFFGSGGHKKKTCLWEKSFNCVSTDSTLKFTKKKIKTQNNTAEFREHLVTPESTKITVDAIHRYRTETSVKSNPFVSLEKTSKKKDL